MIDVDVDVAAAEVDPVAELIGEIQGAALQIYCARAGETVGGNKVYEQADALLDAAKLLTLSKNETWMRQAVEHAAFALGLPSIWPSSAAAETGESGGRSAEDTPPE